MGSWFGEEESAAASSAPSASASGSAVPMLAIAVAPATSSFDAERRAHSPMMALPVPAPSSAAASASARHSTSVFTDGALHAAVRSGDSQVMQFLRHMALCNTCVPSFAAPSSSSASASGSAALADGPSPFEDAPSTSTAASASASTSALPLSGVSTKPRGASMDRKSALDAAAGHSGSGEAAAEEQRQLLYADVVYASSSPDELALVDAAKRLGVVLVKRCVCALSSFYLPLSRSNR
jgi:hypothetical protein